jgi:HK97 family phage major capsid protein
LNIGDRSRYIGDDRPLLHCWPAARRESLGCALRFRRAPNLAGLLPQNIAAAFHYSVLASRTLSSALSLGADKMSRVPYSTPYPFTPVELDQIVRDGAGAETGFRNTMRQAHGRMKAINDRAATEGRDFTPEELRESKALSRQFDDAEDKADAIAEGRFELPSAGRVVRPELPLNHAGDALYDGNRSPVSGGRRFRDMFPERRPDPYGGKFKNLGEFCRAVIAGNDQRLMVTNAAMAEGTGTAGGFMVPEEWAWGVLDTALQDEVIRPRALVLPMNGSVLNVPGFDYQDGTGNKRAGLLMTWGPEAGTLTEQAAKTRAVMLSAHKATILVRVSSELLEDGHVFDVALQAAMAAAVQIGLDVAFIAGIGAAQPLGITNAPATITVVKESGQAANTIFVQNLANMLGKLSPASYAKAVWFVHPTCVSKLLQMTVVVQNVAGTENVGGSTAGLVTQQDGVLRIAGKEVIVTEACSVLSTAGDVILADVSQYAVGLRRDVTILQSQHVYLTTDEVAFRLRLRLDGQPLAAGPTKLKDGTATVSPFVILGAR